MIIETTALTKQYKGQGGFKDISLSVKEGEVFGFLGRNGAGKSTFVRTLLGLLHVESGKGSLLGQPIGHIETRKQIGYLPELFQFHLWLTGYELLFHHGLLYKMDKSVIRERIPKVMETVGLTGHENKRIKNYSKGMKQRIGLAVTLLSDPKLLFFDEPTSALDPLGRKNVRDIILQLKKEGKTIFLNTHLLNEVEMVADRIAIIDKGHLIKTGVIEELSQSGVLCEIGNMNESLAAALRKYDPALELNLIETGLNRIELSHIEDKLLPNIAKTIIDHKGALYSMKRKESILEDLFIKTVEGEDI